MARGRQRGRRLKLTEELMDRIAGQVKKGNTIKTACMACGIGQTTFYDWKARGEDDRAGTADQKPRRTIYVTFLETLEHADAVAQQRLVGRVLKLGGWKGAMEILKRRWPKEYGDKTALMNGDGSPLASAPVNVNFSFDQPEDDDPFIYKEAAEQSDQPTE